MPKQARGKLVELTELSTDFIRVLNSSREVMYLNPSFRKFIGVDDISQFQLSQLHPDSSLKIIKTSRTFLL